MVQEKGIIELKTSHPETRESLEIQKEFHGKGGKLAKYQDLILGEKSLWSLFKYECITSLLAGMPGAAGLFLRAKFYPRLLGRSGRNVTFGRGVVLRHPRKIRIGSDVVIDDQCVLDAKGKDNAGIDIGNGVFIGRNTILNCKNGDIVLEDNVNIGSSCTIFSASRVTVGANELLAAYCYLVGGTHRFDDPAVPVLFQGRESKGIDVGPGGWLGAHVTVFDGVRIGRNVVVGAGSVVNRSVPDFAIAAGVPAKTIRKRKARLPAAGGNNKKKILYLSVYDPSVPYTGAGVRGTQFVRFLARHFRVDAVYMEGSGHPGNPELEKRFSGRLAGVREKVRVPFTKKGYFLFSRELYRAAEALVRRNAYDFIVADYGLSARYACRLLKKWNIPFVYCPHNVEHRQYIGKLRSDPRRLPLIPYVYRTEKLGCRRASLVVAISDEDATFFSRWTPPGRIVVVPQGFDDGEYNPHYRPVPGRRGKIVLFFGNFNISTNREAVRAVYESIAGPVLARFPDVRFQFVGANPPAIEHPAFEFTGFVDSMLPYLKRADVVISPILSGWGMPTKVIESLACGKRVIATEAGARTVPRHYRRLTVCSIDEFPDALVGALLENKPVDGRDFGKLRADYLWENRLNRMLEKMKDVFNKPK
jgi:acetyltransferase-like isoleucine patch superfamily enzyme/glycosyltransferase involved in cell wall biosynthesis